MNRILPTVSATPTLVTQLAARLLLLLLICFGGTGFGFFFMKV
jgi:hypothetical protein